MIIVESILSSCSQQDSSKTHLLSDKKPLFKMLKYEMGQWCGMEAGSLSRKVSEWSLWRGNWDGLLRNVQLCGWFYERHVLIIIW